MTCPDCNGTQEYRGFNTVEPCRTCCGAKPPVSITLTPEQQREVRAHIRTQALLEAQSGKYASVLPLLAKINASILEGCYSLDLDGIKKIDAPPPRVAGEQPDAWDKIMEAVDASDERVGLTHLSHGAPGKPQDEDTKERIVVPKNADMDRAARELTKMLGLQGSDLPPSPKKNPDQLRINIHLNSKVEQDAVKVAFEALNDLAGESGPRVRIRYESHDNHTVTAWMERTA